MVTAVVSTLTTELVCALAMCGIGSIDDIDPGVLWENYVHGLPG
jgi:hypothetical protein